MGGGTWKQEPRRGELKTLERQKAHESIGTDRRVTPPPVNGLRRGDIP